MRPSFHGLFARARVLRLLPTPNFTRSPCLRHTIADVVARFAGFHQRQQELAESFDDKDLSDGWGSLTAFAQPRTARQTLVGPDAATGK